MHESVKKTICSLSVSTAVLLCSAALTACVGTGASSDEGSVQEDTGFAMGTTVEQTVYTESTEITSNITDLLINTENTYISWRSDISEVAEINSNATEGGSTKISEQTVSYLKSALAVASDSDGAFDPTVGKLTRLWDFDDHKNQVPDEQKIRDSVKYVGYEKIELNRTSVSINENTYLDLGAIGKGIGCDVIENYLDEREDVRGALINIGGSSILSYGQKDNGKPWKIAVIDPRNKSGYLGTLSLENTNHISTSGDYERYFEKDGRRYHHILDPSTGFPADSGLISVTVVTDNGAYSDALSTACFVVGYQKSLDLLKKYNGEAVFVDVEKNVYVTEGLESRFELTADGYKTVNLN